MITTTTFLKSRFMFLLISLLFLLLLSPYLEGRLFLNWFFLVLMLLVFISVIYTVKAKVISISIFFIFAALSLIFNTLDTLYGGSIYQLLGNICFVIFFIAASISFAKEIMTAENVTQDTMVGAICVYLLIGIAFAYIYAVVELLHPGSFQHISPGMDKALSDSDFIYFSFITLTTVGYGDIAVLTAQAKSVVIIESITGIFYLATLVARLVSMRVK